MNKKLLSVSALVVIFAFGFLYLNQAYLVAHDKTSSGCDKSSCDKTAGIKSSSNKTNCDKSSCDKSSCEENKSQIKAGGEYSSYQFVTDKVTCEDTKADLQKNILGIAGVKEVSFGSTCNISKMTSVTVMYSAGETSEENIASVLKEKNMDCSGNSGCDKDGKKSGEKKEGCDTKKECPSGKKKSNDSKQL